MVGPDPAVARIRTAVRQFLQAGIAGGGLAPGALVLVACSGGPDSVALASQLAFVAPKLGLRAGAVIVDHGLQPGSDEVAAHAASTCTGLGLAPVQVVRAAAAKATEGAARDVRYRALQQALADLGGCWMLLGHTADDQAETVLLAAGRGGGTRSLAGMAALRGPFGRPLLGHRRTDTHLACAALNLPYETDPSNAVEGPWRRADGGPVPRAAVREQVLPVLHQALGRDPIPALERTARLARADADYLDELADAAAERCRADHGWSAAALAAEPEPLRTRVLHRAAVAAGAPAVDVTERQVAAMAALVTDWRGQGPVALPGAISVRRDCGTLVFNADR